MGTCANIAKPVLKQNSQQVICYYPSKVSINIKSKNRDQPQTQTELVLTKPLSSNIENISINSQNYWISLCILPGQDPYTNYFQKCLDSCMFLHNHFSILLCLFDGHGPEGEKVINFCCAFVTKYFKTKTELIQVKSKQVNPEIFLKDLIELCDSSLRSSENELNTDYSGSTAAFVLLVNDSVYSASVGDSRAILGSHEKKEPLFPIQGREENSALAELKIRRGSRLKREIHPLQLTREHKPNEELEAQRITEAGGRIKRITDEEGNRVGPYRVWESHTNKPGLTLSRSIGDNVAKSIGVISTPDLYKCVINKKNDLFIVVASDGVWDVMDNYDVISFVENFREKSYRVPKKCRDTPCLANACIAQLICEEARVRWLSIVEEDCVGIDDISCIVLEINKGSPDIQMIEKGFGRKRDSVILNNEIVGEQEGDKVILNHQMPRDVKRGSQINFQSSLPIL